MVTAGSPDEEPEGLDAGPQDVTVWLCDLGQPSDGDDFCSLIQQYVLSAYYVPSIYKKCLGAGDMALNETDSICKKFIF